MTCKDFFEANKENKEKCKLLIDIPETQLQLWEAQCASDLSPGPVEDSEVLYRGISNPTHITPEGDGLKPTAFDDCTSFGLSVHRIAHSTLAEITALGQARAERQNLKITDPSKKRVLWGFACFSVDTLRKMVCSQIGRRVFFVFDTANSDDTSHADVCQAHSNRLEARRFRLALYDLVKGNLQKVC